MSASVAACFKVKAQNMLTSLENWYLAKVLANMEPKSTLMMPDMPQARSARL